MYKMNEDNMLNRFVLFTVALLKNTNFYFKLIAVQYTHLNRLTGYTSATSCA